MYLLITVIKLQNKSFKSIFTGLFLKLCVRLQYLYNNHNQRKVTPAYKKLLYARLIELPVLEKNKIRCQDISFLYIFFKSNPMPSFQQWASLIIIIFIENNILHVKRRHNDYKKKHPSYKFLVVVRVHAKIHVHITDC